MTWITQILYAFSLLLGVAARPALNLFVLGSPAGLFVNYTHLSPNWVPPLNNTSHDKRGQLLLSRRLCFVCVCVNNKTLNIR